jgi:hypothetical protein
VNLSRIKDLGPWLAEGKYVWFALATNLSALIVIALLGASEAVFRITGLFLQVCGILTIIWGISEMRASFGYASIAAKIKGWLQRSTFAAVRFVTVGIQCIQAAVEKSLIRFRTGLQPSLKLRARQDGRQVVES